MMQHRLSQEEKEGFGARGAQEGLGFPRERAVGRREWVPPRDREGGRQAFQSSTECGDLWNCCCWGTLMSRLRMSWLIGHPLSD